MSKKLHLKGEAEKTKCGQEMLLLPVAVMQSATGRIYLPNHSRYITSEETQYLCEKCLSSRVNPLKVRDVVMGQPFQAQVPLRLIQNPIVNDEGGINVRPIRLRY